MRTGSPILLAATASARFVGRRMLSPFLPKPSIETIIVDVDRTLTREDSPKLALQQLCGMREADEIFHGFARRIRKGEVAFDELPLHVFGELYSRGFKRSDWVSLMEKQERTGGLRMGLVESLQRLSEKGITIIPATRSSCDGARWIAGRFGFPSFIGSDERFEGGSFKGFRTIIGMKDSHFNGTSVMTKMTAAKTLLSGSGILFNPGRTAVISNDLLDAMEMLGSAKGILIIPKEPNSLERMTRALRLYDVAIHEDEIAGRISGELGIQGIDIKM